MALVILAVAEEDNGAPHRGFIAGVQQLFLAGQINGVIKGGAAAGLQAINRRRQRFLIVGEILHQLGMAVEADYEGPVGARANHLLEKGEGRILLEGEAASHRTAVVHQQAYPQGQVSLAAKVQNARWRPIVIEHAEIALRKIAHKFSVPVGGRKHHVDLIHSLADSEDRTGTARLFGIGADFRSRLCAAQVRSSGILDLGRGFRCREEQQQDSSEAV